MSTNKKRKIEEKNRGFRSEWTDTYAFVPNNMGQPKLFVTKTSKTIKNLILNVIFDRNTILLVRRTQLEMKEKQQWPSSFVNLNNRHLNLITGCSRRLI